MGSAISLRPVGADDDKEAIGVWPAQVMKVRGMELRWCWKATGLRALPFSTSRGQWRRGRTNDFNAMAHALSHWVNVEDAERCDFEIWLGSCEMAGTT